VIDDIVMDQGGHMEVLKGGSQQIEIVIVATAAARAEHGEQRADAFAAAEQGMVEDFAEQGIASG